MVWPSAGFEQHIDLGDDPLDTFEQDQPVSHGHPAVWIDMTVWDYPVLSIGALIAVSFGVRRMRSVYFATMCQVVYWFSGHKGPAAMWNSLAGLQAGRGNYKYVILPTLLTSYESIENYRQKKGFTYKSQMILGFYGLGYLLGKYKIL